MQRLLERANGQIAVFDRYIFWLAGVILQLLVAPALNPGVGLVVEKTVANVEVPFGRVDLVTVKLVAPNQLPLGICSIIFH